MKKIVLIAIMLIFVLSGFSFRSIGTYSEQCPDGWENKIEAPNPILTGPTVTFTHPMTFCVKAGEKVSGIITGSTFTVTWLNKNEKPFDISHVVTYKPTAVSLLYANVQYIKNGNILTWETASETDNLGFNIYASATINSELIKVNTTLIPSAQPGNSSGSVYIYKDVQDDYPVYWLQSIDIYNNEASMIMFTPVWINYLAIVYAG